MAIRLPTQNTRWVGPGGWPSRFRLPALQDADGHAPGRALVRGPPGPQAPLRRDARRARGQLERVATSPGDEVAAGTGTAQPIGTSVFTCPHRAKCLPNRCAKSGYIQTIVARCARSRISG